MNLATKAIVYRLFAVAITVTVAWLFTGERDLALRIGWLDACLKTAGYYLFDRVWMQRYG